MDAASAPATSKTVSHRLPALPLQRLLEYRAVQGTGVAGSVYQRLVERLSQLPVRIFPEPAPTE